MFSMKNRNEKLKDSKHVSRKKMKLIENPEMPLERKKHDK